MGLFRHGRAQPYSPAVMPWLWTWVARAVPRAVPSTVWLGPARARLQLDPDPPGRCRQELVVAWMHCGGLGVPPARHVPRWLPKARHGLWDWNPDPASPTIPRWFHEPHCSLEAMGMSTLGCPGHGCYPSWTNGGQSLPAPRKAAQRPAQCLSPSALPAGSSAPQRLAGLVSLPTHHGHSTEKGSPVLGGHSLACIGRCRAPLLPWLASAPQPPDSDT